MTKHTPGPWHIVDLPFYDDVEVHAGDSRVAVICEDEPNPTRTRANARLAAAAPNLFAICKEVLAILQDMGMDDSRMGTVLRNVIAEVEYD